MNLITLGELRLTGSSFNRHKPLLLLCFLALEGARPRRYLAELFYGDAKNPLNSLSRALSHLRGVCPDFLQTDDASVATSVACDAKSLETQLDKHDLEASIELYKAPFLQGITLELNAELEEWVLVTREHIAGRVREAHLRLGETLAATGQFDAAARHAEAAYKLSGANELEPEDFARTYALLSAGGSPQAADIRKEAAGFGIRLFLNSDEAKEQLFVEQYAPLPSHNLPRRRTSFVGRAAELEKIKEVFTDARHRLLTLLGPGGVGKSRLAVEAAYEQLRAERFRDGTTLVELDPIASPMLIPGAVAEALKLELRGSDDALSQIVGSVGNSARLLILDNFEHLIAGAGIIHELLDACPRLSILVTSRERLNLADEWVLELTGLSVSRNSGAGSDALQLFVQRAKRARLGFSLTREELPHAHAICDLVGGFPLGIELAAVWIKLLAPADIAAEIKQNLSFLEAPTRDIPERQRSINAAFEYSWKLLSPAEQTVMRKLSVFNGGFRKEAAAQVAGASLPILASLVDKSLLIALPSSRYERHALLLQFSREKLAEVPQEEAETKAEHAEYFHSFLKNAEADLRGPGAKKAMDTIEVEFENIRLAWGWAVEHEDAEALTHSAIPLRLFFDRRGRFQDGIDLYNQVLEKFKKETVSNQRILGYALINKSWLLQRRGGRDETSKLATQGLTLLKRLEDSKGILEGLDILGVLKWQTGDYTEAVSYWQDGLKLAKELKSHQATIRLSNHLGILYGWLGEYAKARNYLRESLVLFQQSGNEAAMVAALNNLGTLEADATNLEEAERLLKKGLKLARKLDAQQDTPYLLNNLADVALKRGNHTEAHSLSLEALKAAQAIDEKSYEARIQETLGRIAIAVNEHQQARMRFERSLEIAFETNGTPMMLQALTGIALLLSKQNHTEQAAKLVGLVLNHRSLSKRVETLAQQVLQELRESVPEIELATILTHSKKLDLSKFVREMLN